MWLFPDFEGPLLWVSLSDKPYHLGSILGPLSFGNSCTSGNVATLGYSSCGTGAIVNPYYVDIVSASLLFSHWFFSWRRNRCLQPGSTLSRSITASNSTSTWVHARQV